MTELDGQPRDLHVASEFVERHPTSRPGDDTVDPTLHLLRHLITRGAVVWTLAALAALAEPGAPATAQESASADATLEVGPDTPVSADAPGLTHVEPHLAVDPGAPDRLLGAVIVFRDGVMTSDVLRSDDGGGSWARTAFPACAGDPWVVWGSDQNAYFSCLAAGGAPVGVLVHRSEDGGRSWSDPVAVPRGGGGSFDHTALAVWPRPDSDDIVYMAGMQGLRSEDRPPISAPFVAVSTDGGHSFGPPHRIVISNVMANALNPLVLGPERLGVAFVDFSVDGRSMIDHRRLWWVRSDDRGRSFSLPHLAADVSRIRTGPVMAARPDSSTAGEIYLAYDNVIDGRQGVFFSRSDDHGVSWSAPSPLATGDAATFHAENPVTAVDPDGNVGVAWYERPPDADPGCWRVRFALSTDGGATFLEPVTVSSERFCARRGEVDGAGRWRVGGDYFGLAATGRGAFRVLWADSRSGVWALRTAEVSLAGLE